MRRACFAAGSDGSNGHTVTCKDTWIFDATETSGALPLTRQSLDSCVDGNGTNVLCTGIAKALVLSPTDRLIKSATRLEGCHPLLK